MFKPGSRKASVYTHLGERNDPDATIAFGVTLGLAEGTVRSWVRSWTKDGPVSNAPRRKAESKGKVYDIGSPKRHGAVIVQGEQISEVRWDDGHLQFITNEYLRPVKSESEDAERG